MSSPPKDGDDPPIAYNVIPIPPPYVVPPTTVGTTVPRPYVAALPTTGIRPVSLPGSHSANAGSATGIRSVYLPGSHFGPDAATNAGSVKDATSKKKEKKSKKEPQTSIEAILVSPPYTKNEMNPQMRHQNQNQNVLLLPETDAVAIPPPFLFPTGTMHLSDVVFPDDSKSWKLSGKLSKGCKMLDVSKAAATSRHRELKIPIEASDIVLYACAKKDNNGDDLAKNIDNNSLADLTITRTHRSAILTLGSLQFKKPSFSITSCVVFVREKESPNINVSLFDLRGIHVGDSSNNAVIVAFRKQQEQGETIRYVIYQTPEIGRLLLPLTKAVIAAYTGVPRWAIPITWSGNLPPLPTIPQHEYTAWMGSDGGFSSFVYAAVLGYHVRNKISFVQFEHGPDVISRAVMKQQPRRSFPAVSSDPREIDLLKLRGTLATDKEIGCRIEMVLAGLHALCFNLVFRKLKLARVERLYPEYLRAFRTALGRTLLYNVTLREVDFELADLSGFGETIGNAWAMNVQPLISRINFSGCKLTGDDLHGLLHGLARIWCGGTALAEVIRMANNPYIPTKTWDVFFRAFVDPSTLSSWPKKSPPPPNLSFLQELDIRGTKAVGPGLVQIAEKLTGLRSLKLSSAGGSTQVQDVLSALLSANAPLEIFKFAGNGSSEDTPIIEALFQHYRTLKEIALIGFRGDARPLLSNWPQPMPNLSLDIGKEYVPTSQPHAQTSEYPSCSGNSPGTIFLRNTDNFSVKAMEILANSAVGLKKLVVYDTFYWELIGATYTLADCGLETLHIHPPKNNHTERSMIAKMRSVGLSQINVFWKTLARSKTLRDIQCPDQLMGGSNSYEVAMVGNFLKSNRSVQNIGFDHSLLILKVEDVKILRSAFYGNKKVVRMEYLSQAKQATLQAFKTSTDALLRDVSFYKSQIKKLFQSAYSKYNRFWRDGPNRAKLPWIEKIREAKRKIGRLNRDQAKIASLLNEIINCIHINKLTRANIEDQKANERLERREGQLKQLATKKKKFVTNLVTKLRKAKMRGRQNKSAKMQVPRSTYYKSCLIWPSNNRRRRRHSYYDYYNDPYYVRDHYWRYDDNTYSDSKNDSDGETDCDWLQSAMQETSIESEDPWANLDSLVQELDYNYSSAIDTEYLAYIHQECSELGIDVVEDLSKTLDDGAAVVDKLDEIGTSMNVPNDMLTAIADSSLGEPFDLAAIERTLPDIGEYETETDGNDRDDVMDANDAVGMYAGAGPRDLDDGGPYFGGSSNAALAGARRRARARKKRMSMSRIREKANRRLKAGYRNLSIAETSPSLEICKKESVWPDNIVSSWIEEARIQQVKAMAESDLFDVPDVSSKAHSLLAEWSCISCDQQQSLAYIEVVLVTQCSIDRLPNLQAQLASWTGKASIAVYLKPAENKLDAIGDILSTIKEAKTIAGNKNFDVVVTLVEGCLEEEPYPINYLRNVALLEARRQHLRLSTSLDKSATLLVDVDFRPSSNLYEMLHSKSAENYILKEGKVVVCPAFESNASTCPRSISSLKELVDNGQAEGFHQSHFPQGHGPTRFDIFWKKSSHCPDYAMEKTEDYFWNEGYDIGHKDLFEPYIVMASGDVPLYDERFQGYGLNKVSHLASVSRKKGGAFFVLPGVFVVAPAHERSEAWSKIYGNSQSDDNKFNQLVLKGLYYKFMKDLQGDKDPIVSENTQTKLRLLLQQERESKQKQHALNESIQSHQVVHPTKHVLCY